MRQHITARVQVVVEIDINMGNWNETSTLEQVHREGEQKAIETITELCKRYVRLIGKPKVEAIIAPKER